MQRSYFSGNVPVRGGSTEENYEVEYSGNLSYLFPCVLLAGKPHWPVWRLHWKLRESSWHCQEGHAVRSSLSNSCRGTKKYYICMSDTYNYTSKMLHQWQFGTISLPLLALQLCSTLQFSVQLDRSWYPFSFGIRGWLSSSPSTWDSFKKEKKMNC